MSDMNNKLATDLFEMVKDLLTEMEVEFEEHEGDLTLQFDYSGDDMRHRMFVEVNPDASVLRTVEVLPFDVDPARAPQILDACNRINSAIVLGSFVYDMDETILFSISQLFYNSIISREAVHLQIVRTVQMTEDFDDRFVAVNKGYLAPEDMLKGLVED